MLVGGLLLDVTSRGFPQGVAPAPQAHAVEEFFNSHIEFSLADYLGQDICNQ
jgi:hypothetical protein